MLAKAHEILENKEGAIQFYKEALKSNCENFEAFNRLITNFLLTKAQKEELLRELTFSTEHLWLKDLYLSKIRQEVRQSCEHEGVIRRRLYNDGISSHLCLRSIHQDDESGATPPRFLTDVDEPLRKAREVTSVASNITAGIKTHAQ